MSPPVDGGQARRSPRLLDDRLRCSNGTYYLEVRILWRGQRRLRLKRSLGTGDAHEATRRRDAAIERLRQNPDVTLLDA